MFAAEIHRKRVNAMRARTYWRWYFYDVYVRINGKMLEAYVTTSPDKAAALKFIKQAMKRHGPGGMLSSHGLNRVYVWANYA